VFFDAHCHPFDLASIYPEAEQERRELGVCCVASASSMEEFIYCEDLAKKAEDDGAAGILPCFAIHPQLPSAIINSGQKYTDRELSEGLETLENLASLNRLKAIGETGFDLYNEDFRATETSQDKLFDVHLKTAIRYDLPIIIHSRRAMHKIFLYSGQLKKCRAVIFHSWPGTKAEGEALLQRGINAYFSFSAVIMLNHHKAKNCCAVFPENRLLFETDAPFLAPRDRSFSNWKDLPMIYKAAAVLRCGTENPGQYTSELENQIKTNFVAIFGNQLF